jgi:hypothetical protein
MWQPVSEVRDNGCYNVIISAWFVIESCVVHCFCPHMVCTKDLVRTQVQYVTYRIFLNTPCPRISQAPHFLRSKNLKIVKNLNSMKNLIFFSNMSADNKQFLNLDTLFFVFLPQLQPLLSSSGVLQCLGYVIVSYSSSALSNQNYARSG